VKSASTNIPKTFGGLAFALRAFLPGIGVPILGFLIEPRDVASIVGPGFAGPIGAIIIGTSARLAPSVFCVQVCVPLWILWALIFYYFRHPWYCVPLTLAC